MNKNALNALKTYYMWGIVKKKTRKTTIQKIKVYISKADRIVYHIKTVNCIYLNGADHYLKMKKQVYFILTFFARNGLKFRYIFLS